MKSAELATLGNLTTHVSSGATPRGGDSTYLADGPVMFIRSQHVHMDGLRLDDISYIADDVDAKMKRSRVLPGDVLLNITGASLGRVAAFDLDKTRANVNQHVCIIRPKPEQLDYRYLVHFLRRDEFQRQINGMQNGGTRQALNFAQIKRFEIPLPAITEQRRIAGILDAADAIRRKRQQAIALTEQFLRSTFLDMFGDPVTNPKGWPVERLEHLASVNRGKFTPRPRNDPKYYDGEYPFIQTGDLANCEGLLCAWQQTLNEEGIKVSRLFPRGTVAIAIAANIGDTAILDFDAYATDSVVGIIADPLKAMPRYIEYSLRFHQQRLKDQAPETAQKNINLQVLRPLGICCPPLTLQRHFEQVAVQLDEDKSKLTDSTVKSDSLFNSLVQRAFRGEL